MQNLNKDLCPRVPVGGGEGELLQQTQPTRLRANAVHLSRVSTMLLLVVVVVVVLLVLVVILLLLLLLLQLEGGGWRGGGRSGGGVDR